MTGLSKIGKFRNNIPLYVKQFFYGRVVDSRQTIKRDMIYPKSLISLLA